VPEKSEETLDDPAPDASALGDGHDGGRSALAVERPESESVRKFREAGEPLAKRQARIIAERQEKDRLSMENIEAFRRSLITRAVEETEEDVPTVPDASALGTATTPPFASAPDVEEHQEATESVENTSYASAPDIHSAVRSAPDVEGFRSLLRDVQARDQKRQDLIDQVAAFDEHAVALLERGEMFTEADVPKGIGRAFLSRYEDKIDPEVFYLLDQRQRKKDRATVLWERSMKMPETIRDELRQKVRRLREEVKLGNYAIDDTKASQQPVQRYSTVVQREDRSAPAVPGE
jgi:hypothetical protein